MSGVDYVVLGDVVLPSGVIEDGYVAVTGEKVVGVGKGKPPLLTKMIDHRGSWIFPGVIDGQVHIGSPAEEEGFDYGSRAAAAGGVTTIVDMPYDAKGMVSHRARLDEKIAEASRDARVDFALFGTVHPDEGTEKVQELVDGGVCCFKLSTFGTDPGRFPRIPPQQMEAVMRAVAPHGLAVGVHNENHEYVMAATEAVHAQGLTGPEAHALARPALAEALAIGEIYEIGATTGCPAHVVHCSIGRGYELAEAYKRMGHRSTIECCIHYLVLCEEEDVMRLGGRAKINPPIRGRAEREALWQHLAAGNIDFVSTDHVAWKPDRKDDPNMLANASGAPGLEMLLPLLIRGCLERGIDLSMVARLLTDTPARHFRLHPRKGALEMGCDADFVIVERADHTYDASNSQTITKWSPYEGLRIPVRVASTYVRGKQVWDGAQVTAETGFGNYIRPFGQK